MLTVKMETTSFLLFPFSLSALSLHAVNYLNTAYLTITLAVPSETIHALQRRFISSNMRWNAFIVFNCIARVLVINSNLQLFVFLQSKKKYTIVVKSKHLFSDWSTLGHVIVTRQNMKKAPLFDFYSTWHSKETTDYLSIKW